MSAPGFAFGSRCPSTVSSPVRTRASTTRSARAACDFTSGCFRSGSGARCRALEGGEVNESNAVAEELWENVGATVDGTEHVRRPSGTVGSREAVERSGGETNPPYHHPVFVITHHPREPLVLEGGDDVPLRHERHRGCARSGANRRAGQGRFARRAGAKAAQEYLAAGLVDEMEINVVPTLLGSGERLFDGIDDLRGARARAHGRGAERDPSEVRASREELMMIIDHVGIPVSDIEREQSVLPEGRSRRLRDRDHDGLRRCRRARQGRQAGFLDRRPSGAAARSRTSRTSRSSRSRALSSTRSTRPRSRPAAGDNGKPGIREQYHPTYYGAFVLDPAATTSKPSAIGGGLI